MFEFANKLFCYVLQRGNAISVDAVLPHEECTLASKGYDLRKLDEDLWCAE